MTARRLRFVPVAAAGLVLALVVEAFAGVEVRSTEEALDQLDAASTKVYAADGTLIANLHGEVNRDVAAFDEIPEVVRDAVVAMEDARFWDHSGIDLEGITRALLANLRNVRGSEVQGGSTITQQLVKNLYISEPQRTLRRKLTEASLALDLERRFGKQKILEMYLNTVYLGRGVYGVAAAADAYFRKDLAELSEGEAAVLAGLIHEPGRYQWSPDDPASKRESRREALRGRRDVVLERMADVGSIDREAVKAAQATPLAVEPPPERRWEHPYFVDMVLRRLGVLGSSGPGSLDDRFGVLGESPAERADRVYQGGLRIQTTLDPGAQAEAEEAMAEAMPDGVDKLSGALAAVDPESGAVRALVGGRDYYPEGCGPDVPEAERPRACRIAKVNLALGETGGGSGRQPGSAFKPFTLATAIEDGVPLKQAYASDPFEHDLPQGPWKVRNYSGRSRGRMSVVNATVHSVNAAYARLMIDGVGDGEALSGSTKVADLARRMGFSFPTEDELRDRCGDSYGSTGACTAADGVPAIALGAKEVSPLEMASAYATFANDGVRVEPTAIERISTASGEVLYEAEPERERAVDTDVARGVTHVLRQVVNRGTGTGADLPRPEAGKTGTSQMWRDAWFAGYVPQLATVVWMGNPLLVEEDGRRQVESMTPSNGYPRRVAGGSYPASAWRTFMLEAMQGVPEEGFSDPPRSVFAGDEDEREDERRIVAEASEETPEETPEVDAASSEGRHTPRTPRPPKKPQQVRGGGSEDGDDGG